MKHPSECDILVKVLEKLASYDKETRLELWNLLYDWGNRLPRFASTVELVALSDDGISQASKDLLKDLQAEATSIGEGIRRALLEYAQRTSSLSLQ